MKIRHTKEHEYRGVVYRTSYIDLDTAGLGDNASMQVHYGVGLSCGNIHDGVGFNIPQIEGSWVVNADDIIALADFIKQERERKHLPSTLPDSV